MYFSPARGHRNAAALMKQLWFYNQHFTLCSHLELSLSARAEHGKKKKNLPGASGTS